MFRHGRNSFSLLLQLITAHSNLSFAPHVCSIDFYSYGHEYCIRWKRGHNSLNLVENGNHNWDGKQRWGHVGESHTCSWLNGLFSVNAPRRQGIFLLWEHQKFTLHTFAQRIIASLPEVCTVRCVLSNPSSRLSSSIRYEAPRLSIPPPPLPLSCQPTKESRGVGVGYFNSRTPPSLCRGENPPGWDTSTNQPHFYPSLFQIFKFFFRAAPLCSTLKSYLRCVSTV